MVKILVWDSVGNVLWGVRLQQIIGENWRDKLSPDDDAAIDSAPTFEELFADYDVELVECKSLADVEANMADAEFLNIHKVNVPGDVLLKGKRLRLVQHLGLDYRGIPMDAARTLGVPVAATPLVNYLAVAEHNWSLILNFLKNLPQQREYMKRRDYQN